MFMKLVLMEELALAGAPFGPLAGVWQTADAIIDFGTERLRRELLPAIARGEATFWQGYSEPTPARIFWLLKTEARRDGEHYVIRGHKSGRATPASRRTGSSFTDERGGADAVAVQHVRGGERNTGHGQFAPSGA
jgi:alkylation response protein AidB-like acyl-CoA dehydrogenase